MARKATTTQSIYFPQTEWDELLRVTRRAGSNNSKFLLAMARKLLAGEIDVEGDPVGIECPPYPVPPRVLTPDEKAELRAALEQIQTQGVPMSAAVIHLEGEPKPGKPHQIRDKGYPGTPADLSMCCHVALVEAPEGDSLVTRCEKCRNFVSMRNKPKEES